RRAAGAATPGDVARMSGGRGPPLGRQRGDDGSVVRTTGGASVSEPLSSPAPARPARRRFTRIVPTDEGHGVTTLELFFDLVFVFAITQITAFMASDLGVRGCLRGLVLLSLLWFAWCSYSWLGNQAHADE